MVNLDLNNGSSTELLFAWVFMFLFIRLSYRWQHTTHKIIDDFEAVTCLLEGTVEEHSIRLTTVFMCTKGGF